MSAATPSRRGLPTTSSDASAPRDIRATPSKATPKKELTMARSAPSLRPAPPPPPMRRPLLPLVEPPPLDLPEAPEVKEAEAQQAEALSARNRGEKRGKRTSVSWAISSSMPAEGFMAALAAQQSSSTYQYPALQPLPEGMFEKEMAASDAAEAAAAKRVHDIAPLILSPTATKVSSGFEVSSNASSSTVAPSTITAATTSTSSVGGATAPVTPARSGIGMGLLGRAMAKQASTSSTPSSTIPLTVAPSTTPAQSSIVSPSQGGKNAVSPNGALRQGATTTNQPTIHSGSFRDRPHSAIAGSYTSTGIMAGANNMSGVNAFANANMLGKSPTILSVMQNVGGEFGSLPRSSSGSVSGFQTARTARVSSRAAPIAPQPKPVVVAKKGMSTARGSHMGDDDLDLQFSISLGRNDDHGLARDPTDDMDPFA